MTALRRARSNAWRTAGALFVNGDRMLLVHKTYGNGWDIPGDYGDTGESPAN